MLKNVIGIDGRDFLLTSNTDMKALKSQALSAVRDGGGFVELDVLGHQSVSVLISPGTVMVFESQEVDYKTLLGSFDDTVTDS